jgi:hypothetical protein
MNEINLRNINVWWVNIGLTYMQSLNGGYLWAPLVSDRGMKIAYWSTVAEVRRDDIIVVCNKGKIVALGRAKSEPYLADRPSRFDSPSWSNDRGRKVDVEYYEFKRPIMVSAVAMSIKDLEIFQGPLNKNAKPKQSYLHRFSIKGLKILRLASDCRWPKWADSF